MNPQLTDNWIEILPSMLYQVRKKSKARIQEFEPFIIQHPFSAAEYASICIHGPWPEAESMIGTDANASFHYAKTVMKGRFQNGENAIASDASLSIKYAKEIIGSSFPLGEPIIATTTYSLAYARDILKGRFIQGERILAEAETVHGNSQFAKEYHDYVIKQSSDWKDWTEDQLKISPCWMYLYAKQYIKGRLPSVLHNHMLAFGMTLKENYYVKKYFKAKKYQKKVKYRRKKKFSTTADEVSSVLGNN